MLKDLFEISYGNKFDNNKMEHDNPSVNFVSRTEKNNGVSAIVDKIQDIEPFDAGNMTIALGGSIGKCFVQVEPFYTGQNMAVLYTKELSTETKIFLSNIIMTEAHIRFCAFGRELNRHIKTDFSIRLPIQRNVDGSPKKDISCKYNSNGYIPDWDFMETYIKSLLYGDRI